MTDQISQKSLNNALATLSELLSDKNNEPIAMLGMLGLQMRRLYAAKLAQAQNLGAAYVKEVSGCKYDFQVTKLMQAARGYSLPQLKKAVELCAETDYRLKSSGGDDRIGRGLLSARRHDARRRPGRDLDAAARAVSSVANYLYNRFAVFGGKNYEKGATLKYFGLVIIVLLLGMLVQRLTAQVPGGDFIHSLIKFVYDTVMFVVNYIIQRDFVFKIKKRKS